MKMSEQEEFEFRLRYEQEQGQQGKTGSVAPASTGFLQKANQVGGKIMQTGLDVLNAPFEVVGESLRLPVEGMLDGGLAKPLSDFRAPTIVQKAFPSTKSDLPPENPFSLVNKTVQAGGGFVAGLPDGLDSAVQGARDAYSMDRGIGGAAADTALALLSGKLTPGAANAPIDAAIKGGKAVLGAGKNATKFLGKKAIRAGLGPTEEAQSALMHRPDAVLAKTTYDDLSDEFAETLNGLQQKVEKLDDDAWGSLLKLKAEPRKKIVRFLQETRNELKVKGGEGVGAADKKAIATIENLIEDVKKVGNKGTTKGTDAMLDQQQIRQILLAARRNINWQDESATPTNNAIKAFQGKVDAYLKKQNPEYEEIMEPLARATDALESARLKFRPKVEKGRFAGSDAAADKLSVIGLSRGKKPETNRILEKLKAETGRDFSDEARLTRFRGEFLPGKDNARGSMRTNYGMAVGSALGGAMGGWPGGGIGMAMGGAAGRYLDVYGGSLTQKLIQAIQEGQRIGGQAVTSAGAAPGVSPLLELIRALTPYRATASPLASYGASRQSSGR